MDGLEAMATTHMRQTQIYLGNHPEPMKPLVHGSVEKKINMIQNCKYLYYKITAENRQICFPFELPEFLLRSRVYNSLEIVQEIHWKFIYLLTRGARRSYNKPTVLRKACTIQRHTITRLRSLNKYQPPHCAD